MRYTASRPYKERIGKATARPGLVQRIVLVGKQWGRLKQEMWRDFAWPARQLPNLAVRLRHVIDTDAGEGFWGLS